MKNTHINRALRATVTNFVPASKRRTKKPKMTMKRFFEDLENRGPLTPNSLFEKWTKEIREDMRRSGSWIEGNFTYQQEIEFVTEYLARLQKKFMNLACDSLPEHTHYTHIIFYPTNLMKAFRAFRKIYIKIRVWGLRKNLFEIKKWNKTSWYAYAFPLHSIRLRPKQSFQIKNVEVHYYSVSPFLKDCFFERKNTQLRENL